MEQNLQVVGKKGSNSKGRLAQLVRAPALQVATSPLLLSHSPLFSIALHPFRDSAFAQHRTLSGCLTCISDTFLAQQEVPGSYCRGRMLCLKIVSEGDCYSHSRAEALVCDYQLVHASRIRLGVKKSSDQNCRIVSNKTSAILVHAEPSMTTPLFSRAQLFREAFLTVADRAEVEKCRRNHNRLGFAYQVAT